MKKILLLATAALLFTGVSFANTDKGKGKAKKKCCSKDKACSKKGGDCCKDKAKTAQL